MSIFASPELHTNKSQFEIFQKKKFFSLSIKFFSTQKIKTIENIELFTIKIRFTLSKLFNVASISTLVF